MTDDTTYDAVVIGAGPAGAVAARELARRGAAVLLVDKATFPRPKVCGCCLNGAAVAALESVGLGHVLGVCGAVPLRRVHLAAGRTSATVQLPAGVALSRDALDAALIREAERAGVTVRQGTAARLGDDTDPDFRYVHLSAGGVMSAVRARVVIRASGLAGTGAEGGSTPGSRLGAGVVVPPPLAPDFFAAGTIYMATARGGYVGLVRLEDSRLDLGGAFDPDFVKRCSGLGAAAEAVLRSTAWPSIPGLAGLAWKGTPALTRRPATVAARRVFAVGDAAGYVEPFTGEGMAWAVAAAVALGPIARLACTTWNDDLIGEWGRTHARVVGRRQGVCRAAARVLRSPALTRLAVRLLALAPPLARPVVAALNRPFTPPHGLPA